ncbi:integrase core domain-containing protein, partial [Rubrimonas sp.]
MKRSRFTEEQIIGILREQEAGANPFAESFQGRMRDECLNEHLFFS